MGERPPAEMQQLQRFVEAGGVGGIGRHDRVGAVQSIAELRRLERSLTSPHPVAVAHHGVDLAVVGDHPVGVGQRPRRERVGAEPRVHQRQRAGEPLVPQVGVEVGQLIAGEHALVDERVTRERREVHTGFDLVLDPLAEHEGPPLQIESGQRWLAVRGGHDESAELGHRVGGEAAQAAGIGRHGSPPDDAEALVDHDPLDAVRRSVGCVGGKEGDPRCIGALGGELEVADGPEELVRHLNQHPGAVAHVGLGAGRTAMVEVVEALQATLHHLVTLAAVHVDDEAHTARVVLVRGVVEPLGRGSTVAGETLVRHGHRRGGGGVVSAHALRRFRHGIDVLDSNRRSRRDRRIGWWPAGRETGRHWPVARDILTVEVRASKPGINGCGGEGRR